MVYYSTLGIKKKVAGEEHDNIRREKKKRHGRMQMQRNDGRLPGTDAGHAIGTAQVDNGIAAIS
jgi:hypothetical protein